MVASSETFKFRAAEPGVIVPLGGFPWSLLALGHLRQGLRKVVIVPLGGFPWSLQDVGPAYVFYAPGSSSSPSEDSPGRYVGGVEIDVGQASASSSPSEDSPGRYGWQPPVSAAAEEVIVPLGGFPWSLLVVLMIAAILIVYWRHRPPLRIALVATSSGHLIGFYPKGSSSPSEDSPSRYYRTLNTHHRAITSHRPLLRIPLVAT